MSDALFDLPAIDPPPVENLSATQRLTIRNRDLIANGYNPASRLELAGNDETCGTCAHHVVRRHNQIWHKCDLRLTAGPGSDLRISWPACIKWEAQP